MSISDLQAALDILQSEKAERLNKIHSRWGNFREYCWDDIDPAQVAKNLVSDEKPSIYGFRPVLFEALCAWTVAPLNPQHRKAALRYRISNLYFKKLRQVRRDFPYGGEFELIIISQYKNIANFMNELYYGIGGPEGIVRAPTRMALCRRRAERASLVKTVINAMEIAHRVSEANSGNLRGPSQIGICKILSDKEYCTYRNIKKQDEKTTKTHLNNYLPSTAYIYAAKSIQTENHGTLLDAIASNQSFKTIDPYIRDWVGRAAYVERKILRRFPTSSPYSELSTTDDILPISFELPTFTDEQINIIESEFVVREK